MVSKALTVYSEFYGRGSPTAFYISFFTRALEAKRHLNLLLFFKFFLEYSWFMMCYFQVYSRVNQLCIYTSLLNLNFQPLYTLLQHVIFNRDETLALQMKALISEPISFSSVIFLMGGWVLYIFWIIVLCQLHRLSFSHPVVLPFSFVYSVFCSTAALH